LRGIKQMSLYIQKDSFLMAMIDQVYIIGQDQYELIPKMGDQIVLFGDEKNMDKKFEKFKLFYKKIVPQYGWSKYSKIKLDYENQIVATVRGKEDVVADSLRTMAMMRAMAEYNLRMAGDTTQIILQDNASNTTSDSLIFQSLQRDYLEESSGALPETKNVNTSNSLKLDSVNKTNPVVKKESIVKAEKNTNSKKIDNSKKEEKKSPVKNQNKSKSTTKNKST